MEMPIFWAPSAAEPEPLVLPEPEPEELPPPLPPQAARDRDIAKARDSARNFFIAHFPPVFLTVYVGGSELEVFCTSEYHFITNFIKVKRNQVTPVNFVSLHQIYVNYLCKPQNFKIFFPEFFIWPSHFSSGQYCMKSEILG